MSPPAPVPAERWRAVAAARHDEGFTYLDVLTAVDRLGDLDVVAVLVNPDTHEECTLTTRSSQGRIESLVPVFRGADWYEREAAELLGIEFDGHPDPRPLVAPASDRPELLKTTPLPARQTTPWPGAEDEAGARRRRAAVAPGILTTWTQEPQ